MLNIVFIGLCLGLATCVTLFLERKKHQSTLLMDLPATKLLTWAVRFYVSGLFMFSGWVKLNDYTGFAYKLEEYFEVFIEYTPFLEGFWRFWNHQASPLAMFISVFEMALAVAILLGWRMRLTLWLTMIMMVFFTFLTGFSAVTGSVTDCGCFGDAIKLKPIESFFKDIVYMIMITPLFLLRHQISAVMPSKKIAGYGVVLTAVASFAYAFYCHEHLPYVDFLPYNVGKDLKTCTTQFVDGAIKCKDWDEIARMGPEFDPLQGTTLLIVMYDMKTAREVPVRQSAILGAELASKDTTIKVLGMTSTGKSVMEEYMTNYAVKYPISFRDRTMLKTIIRSNPGYVLLKNGVVLGKWHHNDVPSIAAIKALAGK